MNKINWLVSIGLGIIFSIVIVVFVFSSGNFLASKQENVITQKETALKIGRALLEEHFPDAFLDNDIAVDVEEIDGVWRAHNVINRQGETTDGEKWLIVGGEIYVEFRKSNGEITKIGVND